MRVVTALDADDLARRAASEIASSLRAAVRARGHATLAVSGGSTPGDMLEALASETVPWDRLQVFQVDERIAPAGDPDRNIELIRQRLLMNGSSPLLTLHPMPVEEADIEEAADRYAAELRERAGDPPVLDVVQLGLGSDGHTASLLPGDPVVDVTDREVAVSDYHQGWRRMTLTLPVLARARSLVWVVRGSEKRPMVDRLIAGDAAIPAGRVPRTHGVLFVERSAAPSPNGAEGVE